LFHAGNVGGGDMSVTSRIGETCEKTLCSCIVVAVIALTLLAIISVVMVADNSGIAGMFKALFPS
jgi:hypothetical protein